MAYAVETHLELFSSEKNDRRKGPTPGLFTRSRRIQLRAAGVALRGRQLEEVKLDELRPAIEKHYQPNKLVLAERFGLKSKSQKPGQAIHEFYAELQKAANSCQFERIKDHRDAVVMMVCIGGLFSVEVRKRLLEKEYMISKEAVDQAKVIQT